MPTSLIAIVLGFAVLAWAADRFIVGAAATARILGMSPLFIGLTVVALGTSAPEMLVSALAAWGGNPGLAIGNALGSNITNSALVLGAAALVTPLTIRSRALMREFPVLLGIMLLAWLLMKDGNLGLLDGAILVTGVVPLLWWMVIVGRGPDSGSDDTGTQGADEVPEMPLSRAVTWLAIGSLALIASSRAVVWGAVEVATLLGVDDAVIGLSIVAIGTSLPELAASVAGALRNEHDIAVGNVVGSNMFNLLVVLGIPGLIAPGPFAPDIVTRDFPVMVGITLAVVVLTTLRGGQRRLGRFAGAALVLGFVCYQLVLYDKLP